MVRKVESKEEFYQQTGLLKLTIVDFFAVWCGPCKMIAPFLEELDAKFADVDFIKVDVDELEELAGECGITAMPTFQFYRDGKKVAEVKGANKAKLEDLISAHHKEDKVNQA
ncbi:thioredoxin 1 [Sphaeroforma arctica JP610]|uniref:Thioredoxin n=1 Tax=Sphaeroforma arctica JP610 TaxID=667725 RepID=A0A0L0FHJ9_9EUKA|nr:thioredoxin 1 [Sphaeroforma arctica JP610]KNC76249.1 thioredoxin 1 [Sphaeroforma arctica JP610]|eukprot:XP_014150151.1 thioredoxin 1 [Sphaeroforma arctica JP610]